MIISNTTDYLGFKQQKANFSLTNTDNSVMSPMPDIFTETTTQSWGSRFGYSLIGVVFGFIIFIASFGVLFRNEGNAVRQQQALNEGKDSLVVLSSNSVDPTNEGKLVYISGTANSNEVLKDSSFGIKANALKLKRTVTMYQWKERTSTKTTKNLGGSETTTTTYNYGQDWSENIIK
jgi:hypothetical protein